MREELLAIVERNSRIDLKELAVILGAEEIDVVFVCRFHSICQLMAIKSLIELRV